MLPNEVFALKCLARYAREGLVVDSSNGQFAHCPYPKPREQKYKLPDDLGYWLTFFDHQHQGLLQSRDVGRRCYWIPDVKLYLDTKPPEYEELIVIYNEFNALAEEQKKAQSERVSNGNHPMLGRTHTEESIRKMCASQQRIKRLGALNPGSRAIIAIKPDGTKLYFGGVSEAARELEWDAPSLCSRYLIPGKSPTRGRFKYWQFLYAE